MQLGRLASSTGSGTQPARGSPAAPCTHTAKQQQRLSAQGLRASLKTAARKTHLKGRPSPRRASRWPVAMPCSTQPRLNRSASKPQGPCTSCSGAAYRGVPQPAPSRGHQQQGRATELATHSSPLSNSLPDTMLSWPSIRASPTSASLATTPLPALPGVSARSTFCSTKQQRCGIQQHTDKVVLECTSKRALPQANSLRCCCSHPPQA